ncbi:hypothetical protein FQA39_LY01779 [Lamprigera yunnana]|nr:hypothetical protein FQA39_LY01779 [Lamprigera yunnana]
MNIDDFPDDSETSDEDYTPEKTVALPSEEESDGEVEDHLPEADDVGNRGSKRKKHVAKSKKKIKPDLEEAKDKPCVDDLWASFKQDTGFMTRAEREKSAIQPHSVKSNPNPSQDLPKTVTKIKVTEVFKFAGEEVKVEKEVTKTDVNSKVSHVPSSSNRAKPKGGLGSILNQLGKKTKINTLEKSKLDWDQFKKEEQIEDELSAYGKSKDGYLEKQDFLQRADLRQFEIEKGLRSNIRSNKVNNLNI